MVADRTEDLDVVAIAGDELEVAVQVFHVRRGRVLGRNGFVVDLAEDLGPGELVDRVLEGIYGKDPALGMPKLVLVPGEPAELRMHEEWLAQQRGSYVEIRVPQRGAKRALLETVERNAKEEFARHRLKRSADHNSRARALNELQEHLDLPEAPLRIECYDMSHIQGTDYVGSMVVLEDALPKKSEYRRFKVKGCAGNDDFAAMEEVLTRRLTAYLIERGKPVSEREGQVRVPAAAAPRRRRQGPAQRGRPGARRARAHRARSRSRRWPSASRRCTCRVARPDPHPTPVRGALPAPADPRRGPPVRHHVPPASCGASG